MNEMNGTITLAFVEEDNRQRVIFRVIPLCTREGGAFHGTAEDFADEGSLRIVPDKREQSTFKERMREINGLCVIHLVSEGKELMKVRQNRNYSPEQGERNQFAIYSDVVCEFAEDGCFEVVDAGQDATGALTAKVLLHKDKMLYGPVAKADAAQADVAALTAFGNERFLLHTVETPQLGRHRICWDPEATINWRQRRNSLRRRDRGAAAAEDKAAQPKAELKPETKKADEQKAEEAPLSVENAQTPSDKEVEKLSRLDPRSRRVERSAEILRQEEEKARQEKESAQPASLVQEQPADADVALPIGTKLDILDSALPFEQQISRLAQPLSESANRLTADEPAQEEEIPEAIAHFSGTPLSKVGGKITRSRNKPESMHHVVEQQLRSRRDAVMGGEMGAGTYGLVENPIETLMSCLEYVWQNADMRRQAMDELLLNETFVADMSAALRRSGTNLQAAAAAQQQLADIEADRLSLLMQLDMAKTNEKKYREEALAALSAKRREEVERLKREVNQLEATRKKLVEASRVLSEENAAKLTDFIAGNITCLGGSEANRVVLSPVLGHEYTPKELAEMLRIHMNDNGFALNEDESMSLLISFALCDRICLRARTAVDAARFAAVMLESFGLNSVSASVQHTSRVELASLLPEDTRRTPTVAVQPLGAESIDAYGHKTIFFAAEDAMCADLMAAYPVITVPAMAKRVFANSTQWQPAAPASLASFENVRAEIHPLLSEAEKWFGDLRSSLAEANFTLPDATAVGMRRYIAVASRKVRGGFLVAADLAVAHWIVPLLLLHSFDRDKLAQAVAGLPRTMEMLGI